MLDMQIPQKKYNTNDYPKLEDRADNLPIPYRYGVKTNITPICIDIDALKYKLADESLHAIKAIDKIEADGETLIITDDYTVDLVNAEFTIIGTPKLSPNTTYYIVIHGAFTIDGTNFVRFSTNSSVGYADGQRFEIDAGDVWMGKAEDISFAVFGKNSLESEEANKVEFQAIDDGDGRLRDVVARTKIAQSFKTPNDGQSFYVTRVLLFGWRIGTPSGNVWIEIHSDQIGTQVGVDSKTRDSADFPISQTVTRFSFMQRGLPSEILVDIQGYKDGGNLIDNVADILEDVLTNTNALNISSDYLDAVAFADLKAAKTQSINPQIDREITVNNFIEKLERGQMFKFMPTLEGKFAPRVYAGGEFIGTPHLKDEDFIWFKCYRNLASVKQKYLVKYDENPTTQIYLETESSSDIAQYIYRNKETLEIETYLKDESDAPQYKSLSECPQREIEFEVSSYLLDKIPTDKVKITRTRGDNPEGTFDTVLFRILKLTKKQSTGTVVCRAILDSQSYIPTGYMGYCIVVLEG